MFAEELNLIKDAEEKAEQMKQEAKISANHLTGDAKAEVTSIIDAAFEYEKEKCQELIAQGQQEAQRRYDHAIENAQALCVEIKGQAKENQEKAIKFIAERIVKSSVNC